MRNFLSIPAPRRIAVYPPIEAVTGICGKYLNFYRKNLALTKMYCLFYPSLLTELYLKS
jgi:hypothetical protein